MSRPLLETASRCRVLRDRQHVSVVARTAVDRLIVEDGRVVGVTSDSTEHRADLVVACTGRLQMIRVQKLPARPGSLMTPATVVRVLLAARRSPAAVHPSARNSSM